MTASLRRDPELMRVIASEFYGHAHTVAELRAEFDAAVADAASAAGDDETGKRVAGGVHEIAARVRAKFDRLEAVLGGAGAEHAQDLDGIGRAVRDVANDTQQQDEILAC